MMAELLHWNCNIISWKTAARHTAPTETEMECVSLKLKWYRMSISNFLRGY